MSEPAILNKSRPQSARRSTNAKEIPLPLTIYLAGGFHSGWQEQVINAVPNACFLDPRQHELSDEQQYTQHDLEEVRRSDWVFAFFEITNPGGYSLALEVGFAKALGKRIIYIDEKSANDPQTGRYLGMVRSCADFVFSSLEEGIVFLQALPTAKQSNTS